MQQNPYLVLVLFFIAFFSIVIFVNFFTAVWSAILEMRIRHIARNHVPRKVRVARLATPRSDTAPKRSGPQQKRVKKVSG